jgi:hypothetical protein
MPKAFPLELREVVKTMFLAGIRPHIIARENGLSSAIVHRWSKRYGWAVAVNTARAKLKETHNKSLAKLAAVDLAASSANVRTSLAGTLEKQAAALARHEPKLGDLANTRERQGQAAVAKTIMETAKGVFGWGEESRPGMVLQVHLSAELPSKATTASVIDVAAEADQPNTLSLQDQPLKIPDIVRSDCEPGDPAVPAADPASPGAEPAG